MSERPVEEERIFFDRKNKRFLSRHKRPADLAVEADGGAKAELYTTILRGLRETLTSMYAATYNYTETKALMENCGWPGLSEDIRLPGEDDLGRTDAVGEATQDDRERLTRAHLVWKGQLLGSIVDAHLESLVNRTPPPSIKKRTWSVDPWIERHFNGTLPPHLLARAHPLAQFAFRYLHEHKGLRPVRANIPVGCAALRLGTAIDSLWQCDKTGDYVLIEMEVTDGRLYEFGNDELRPPYNGILNSPLNRKQLQLGWTLWLARKSLAVAIPQLGRALVLRLEARAFNPLTYGYGQEEEVATCYPLQDWVLETRRVDCVAARLCGMAETVEKAVVAAQQKRREEAARQAEEANNAEPDVREAKRGAPSNRRSARHGARSVPYPAGRGRRGGGR